MLSARYISLIVPAVMVDLYSQLELDILELFATTLDKTTYTSAWYETKARALQEFQREAQKLTDATQIKGDKVLRSTYLEAIEKSTLNDEQYYKKLASLGLIDNYKEQSRAIATIANEAFRAQKAQLNITNAGVVLDSYNRLNDAFARVSSGAFTREQAVKIAVSEFANDGIRVFTLAGGRQMEVAAYVRMVIETSVSRAVREATFSRMDELGIDLIEVSAHTGARPLCEPYQGQVFSRSGKSTEYPALASTSYGQPAGLFGINCRHTFWAYHPDFPRKLFDNPGKVENDRIYKASQDQRYKERQIRAWKRKADALEQIKGAEKEAANARAKVREWQARQRAQVKDSGLKRDYTRERV
jgi:hypothetical protein